MKFKVQGVDRAGARKSLVVTADDPTEAERIAALQGGLKTPRAVQVPPPDEEQPNVRQADVPVAEYRTPDPPPPSLRQRLSAWRTQRTEKNVAAYAAHFAEMEEQKRRDGYNTVLEGLAIVIFFLCGLVLVIGGCGGMFADRRFANDNAIGAAANANEAMRWAVIMCAGVLLWILAGLIRIRGALRRTE